MNYLDFLIIVFCLIGFLLGYKEGLIRKIIGFIGIIIALFLTVNYYAKVGILLSKLTDFDEYFCKILAAFFIFFFIILVTAIIKRIVHPFDKVNKFINQLLGGILGIFQIVLLLSGIFILLNFANIPSSADKSQSKFYYITYNALPQTVHYILGKDLIKKIENFLKSET